MEVDVNQVDNEILPFLNKTARTDLRCIAMQYFLGLTGTAEGCLFIGSNLKYLESILGLTEDEQEAIAKDAYLCLVNLTTHSEITSKLLELKEIKHYLKKFLTYVLDKDTTHADIVAFLLSNVTRVEDCANIFVEIMTDSSLQFTFDKMVMVFCQKEYNSKNKLHYLAPFLSNLTQITKARACIMKRDRCIFERLLPFINFEESLTRRGGVIGLLRNCAFDVNYHEWLLDENGIDILPRLLLPLAGPEAANFDEDDMEKLPPDLQYLEPDKKREEDPDLRKMLIETIHQLCNLKVCRDYIIGKNTYIIMRELHTSEKDKDVSAAALKFIQLLINDPPSKEMENLNEVVIPEDLEKKFKEYDAAEDDA